VKKGEAHLIVFTKAPVPGEVKTRLIPLLSAERAAHLHAQLVLHGLKTAITSEVGPVDLWCTPSTDHPFFMVHPTFKWVMG
jgi:glycosyltransferase A (GT-A) superfamily protein (DUF2064 family)